ncbi:MAG: hypothetical protein IT537_20920 [Hyphomicrobiales bacterium]|nr:hypothetical protein [Hyphomicrobiales bacterium]
MEKIAGGERQNECHRTGQIIVSGGKLLNMNSGSFQPTEPVRAGCDGA